MNMLKLTICLISIVSFGSMGTMELGQEIRQLYYNAHNLNVLDQLGIQRHAPCMILIDEQETETLTTPLNELANTVVLSFCLKMQTFPIIVTAKLLENLLLRVEFRATKLKNDTNERLHEVIGTISSLNWELYDIPNSQFILLFPKHFLSIYGKNPGFKKNPNISDMLPGTQLDNYLKLINWLQHNKKIIPLNSKNFTQIFVNKNERNTPIWDFVIQGHGLNNPPIIAGLIPDTFNKMLSLFDQYIKTGAIYTISCSAGGKNRTLLETQQDGIQINHNFILLLGSISNSTVAHSYPKMFDTLVNFFNYAGDMRDKGKSLDDLLKSIIFFKPDIISPHGAQSIPQVWLPGGLGFQTLNISDQVLSINEVIVKKHSENKAPIIIKNKAAILLYPNVIDIPLYISPLYWEKPIPKSSWKSFPLLFEESFFKNVDNQTKKEVIDQLKTENILPDFLEQLSELSTQQSPINPNYYLYPEFISMRIDDEAHSFSEIQISTMFEGKQVAQGVLQFIREAFLDILPKHYSQIFFIDKLMGKNDISLLLAAVRILNKSLKKHPLEELLKENINKEITLENVTIQIRYYSGEIIISFKINDTAWRCVQDITNTDMKTWWKFEKSNASYYENFYNEMKEKKKLLTSQPLQKSISEALKQKQVEILKKKTEEQQKIRSKL